MKPKKLLGLIQAKQKFDFVLIPVFPHITHRVRFSSLQILEGRSVIESVVTDGKEADFSTILLTDKYKGGKYLYVFDYVGGVLLEGKIEVAKMELIEKSLTSSANEA